MGPLEHDVLKVLYESIIVASTRKKLGEYYTPDWLAEQVVAEAIKSPLTERVLDPACGSGTFLFHAVRKHILASEKKGRPLSATLDSLTDSVMGLDLHPVAVALRGVPYLWRSEGSGSRIRNGGRSGSRSISVTVCSGGKKGQDLLSSGQLVIEADDEYVARIGGPLNFPDEVLQDSRVFTSS